MHRAQLLTFVLCLSVFAVSGEALSDDLPIQVTASDSNAVSHAALIKDAKVAHAGKVVDLKLTQGKFGGQVVDVQGKAVPGAKVLLANRTNIVSQAVADSKGRFQFAGQKPGVFVLSVAGNGKTLRLWDAKMAPPASTRQLQLVCDGGAVVRAQCCSAGGAACGGCDSCGVGAAGGAYPGHFGGAFQRILRNPWLVGVGTAAAIAIPLATDDDDDNSSGEAGASGESPDAS